MFPTTSDWDIHGHFSDTCELYTTTWSTRQSQWKKYLDFCEFIQPVPIPTDPTLVCRFIVHLSHKLKYVSIVNYVSVLVSLHKWFGYQPTYRSDFLVQYALSGLCRILGNPVPFCPTQELQDLFSLSSHANLRDMNERVMWACVVFSFLHTALQMRPSELHHTGCARTMSGLKVFLPLGHVGQNIQHQNYPSLTTPS